MRKFFQGWFLAAELMLLGCVGAAYANYDGTQGTGTHFVAFDATHAGTSLCAAANTQCPAFVPMTSAGVEIVPSTAANQASILAAVQAPIPTQAPTVPIGAVGIKDSGGTNTAAVSAAGGVATNEIQMAGSTIIANPCRVNTPISKPISITTGTTTNIVTGTSAKKIYVCYLFLTSAAADNVALIEGTTGGTCGSGTAALVGGVTAANGLNFGANGGAAFGNGSDWVFQTQTNNNDICIITSAATPLAGVIKYVVQ